MLVTVIVAQGMIMVTEHILNHRTPNPRHRIHKHQRNRLPHLVEMTLTQHVGCFCFSHDTSY